MSDFSSSLQNCVKMAPLAHFKTVEGSSVKRLSKTHLPHAARYGHVWLRVMPRVAGHCCPQALQLSAEPTAAWQLSVAQRSATTAQKEENKKGGVKD